MRASPDRILDYREYPVLYVDDEPESLRIFELTFRREFSVLTAASGDEALARTRATPIALVLSDQRMPGMSGVDLLTRVHEADPRTVCMLVTGYGDTETLSLAINSGAISRFVPKPWTPDAMRETLRRGIESYAVDREREQLLRELTLLNRVAKSMSQELAMPSLVDLVLATVVEDLRYDAAALLLVEPGQHRLAWERFAPREDAVSAALRELEISRDTAPAFVRRVCDGQAQTLSLEHALQLEGVMRRWVTEVAAEEILVVPILGRDRAVGALAVDNRRGGRRFEADDQTLLEGLAGQAAIAIENARLVEDLRRSRDQLPRGDGLDTLGALAAGLAHAINNPLVSIHTFLQMAPSRRGEEDAEFWGHYHELACSELDRIRELVSTLSMLRPGREAGLPRELVEPEIVARAVAARVEAEAAEADVTLRVELEPGTPKLVVARGQLEQLLGQLARNAIAASPPAGEVTVRVAPDGIRGGVVVEVRDQGDGIPAEELPRIFEPFYTTRGADRAAGLGLAVCHRLVVDQGGTLEVRSREGEGTSFCVWLPAGAGETRGEP